MTENTITLGAGRGVLEIKQFLRSREAVVFTLLFPVMLLGIFSAVFTRPLTPTVTYAHYFIAGMVAAGLLSVGFQNLAVQIPIERDRGMLKRLRGTPMPRAAYFAGKVVMVLCIGVVEVALLLALATAAYGYRLPTAPGKWLTFAWVAGLGITACTLCGIAFSSLPRSGRSASAIVTPVALALQFISGIFIPFTQLPPWMQQVAAVFPLKWMSQGMRAVFLPDSFASSEAAGSWELGRVASALAAWCVAGLVLCLLSFRWSGKRDG